MKLYGDETGDESPAHHSDGFAELVCSNSLRAANIENAVGLLKEELRRLGSLIMESADKAQVSGRRRWRWTEMSFQDI